MWKSPFTHILLFGILLGIGLVVVLGRPSAVEDGTRVVVGASDVEQMRARWVRTWQRPPTEEELRGLVDGFVRDEVLFREAMRLGYDEGDPLIRRSLKLKMEFLGELQAPKVVPGSEEVMAYYAMRKDRYRLSPRVSFVHIYYNPDKRPDAAEDARRDLEALRAADPGPEGLAAFGDRFMLKERYVGEDERGLRSAFGNEFARDVVALEPGDWQGPVQSGYGLHLVKVYEREDGRLPDLKEVEQKVISDMDFDNRNAAKELFYTEILRNYQVEYGEGIEELLGGGEGQ